MRRTLMRSTLTIVRWIPSRPYPNLISKHKTYGNYCYRKKHTTSIQYESPTSSRNRSQHRPTTAREWAVQNPQSARNALSVPPFPPQPPETITTIDREDSSQQKRRELVHDTNLFANTSDDDNNAQWFEHYLTARGWNLPTIVQSTNDSNNNTVLSLPTEEESGLESISKVTNEKYHPFAVDLVSYPLTFPLTLAHYYHTVLSKQRNHNNGSGIIRVCCVGARAEATLPLDYWKELLIATHHSNNAAQPQHFVIDFVGPDVPKGLKPKNIVLQEIEKENEDGCWLGRLDLNFHTGYLHDVVAASVSHNNNQWDAFLLFNPGIGHPHLKSSWESTLNYLLQCDVPILLTAHSELDARRDLEILQNAIQMEYEEYVINPWRSRMEVDDPLNPGHTVTANHSMIVVNSMFNQK